ncbi:hypothetical protein KY332_00345 [Candidatus Woesearchaeota archaeon]|nr:hypothetical protein [Candidatus Woesearchaeota archaeon]
MGIKEKYKELSKKYKLPSFNEINNEFEVSGIEKEDFLLREVRRKIVEKIEIYSDLLHIFLHPEASLCEMFECRAFTDEEKDKIFNVYKKLMFFNRYSIEVSIDEDNEKTAKFIKDVWKDWKDIKENILPTVKKVKGSWLKEIDIKEELRYLG